MLATWVKTLYIPVLYYVNGNLQRAYCTFCTGLWSRNSQKRLEHKENRELLKVIILSGRYPYTEWFYLNRETDTKQKVPNSKRYTNMALYPRQNSRHLIMRRNQKNHIGSPCRSVFHLLSLALLLAHTPYYYTADSLPERSTIHL